MPDETDDLARKIRSAMDALDKLKAKTVDPGERFRIVEQKEALDVQMQRLIAANLQRRGVEYVAATQALDAANAQLESALADLNKLAQGLEAVASAVDFVSKFKPA